MGAAGGALVLRPFQHIRSLLKRDNESGMGGSPWDPTWGWGRPDKTRRFIYSAYRGSLKTAEVPSSYFGRPHQIIGSFGTWNLLKPQVFFTHAPAKPPCVYGYI